MNVVIFEKDHFEGSYPVIKLFDTGRNNITIFCYEHTYRQFKFLFAEQLSRYQWVVKGTSESKYAFMMKLYRFTKKNKADILYLNTVSDNFNFYGLIAYLLKKPRVILTIHNINGFFEHHPPYGFRKWVRFTGRQFLLRQVREFNVVSATMVSYLKSKIATHKKVHCIPGAVYEGRNNLVNDLGGTKDLTTLKITVPGTVDARRRNYETVFELLHQCAASGIRVQVTLAGGYYGETGEAIISQCKEYLKTRDNLVFYEQRTVDQPEFDRALDECHFIFIPTRIRTVIIDDVPETYGESTGSGNLFDIIKHAKPFISPAGLQFDSYLEQSAFRYNAVEEIIKLLQGIQQNPETYQRWKAAAIQASQQFTLEKVRARNKEVFIE